VQWVAQYEQAPLWGADTAALPATSSV
jgi:hypothetical protein